MTQDQLLELEQQLKIARNWLDTMKHHTDCCGVPQMKQLIDTVEKAIDQGFYKERIL